MSKVHRDIPSPPTNQFRCTIKIGKAPTQILMIQAANNVTALGLVAIQHIDFGSDDQLVADLTVSVAYDPTPGDAYSTT